MCHRITDFEFCVGVAMAVVSLAGIPCLIGGGMDIPAYIADA